MAPGIHWLHRDSETLDMLRRGDRQGIIRLLEDNRRPVLSYVTRNNGSDDDGEDVLQEAVVVLWERVMSGSFDHQARLGTFIFATARNMWLRRLARQRREVPLAVDPDTLADGSESGLEHLVSEERVESFRAAFRKLADPCRTLLLLFYWEHLPMEEIAHHVGLANAATAKAKKYQCKETLRRLMKEAGHV